MVYPTLILHIQTKKRDIALTTQESCVKFLCAVQEMSSVVACMSSLEI
jgi:hypothetical protein